MALIPVGLNWHIFDGPLRCFTTNPNCLMVCVVSDVSASMGPLPVKKTLVHVAAGLKRLLGVIGTGILDANYNPI
jgi:hypothetical protein